MFSGDRVEPEVASARLAKNTGANYRPGVGILLVSRGGLAFISRRIFMPTGRARWQMPQGAIDSKEIPRQAVFRELKEEIGTDSAEILVEVAGGSITTCQRI